MVSVLNPILARPDCSDSRDLVQAARAGDADAFCEVCRLYEARLVRQAMTLCGNATLAEDLAQDTLVEAWKCIRRYNGRCQFFTWLCAILLNRYRNQLRQGNLTRSQPEASRTGESASEAIDESTPAQSAEARERAALMLRCINSLPPKQQQVIYLRYYVEDSLTEIAEAVGCSIGTVKSRLFYALENLRAMSAFAREPLPVNLKPSVL